MYLGLSDLMLRVLESAPVCGFLAALTGKNVILPYGTLIVVRLF